MKYLISSTALAIIILVGVTIFPEKTTMYKRGFEEGKTEAMKQIELSNGSTNIDSSIAALKNYPNDSLNIAVFNLYATDEERAFVVQFANWIKRIREK